MDEPNGNELKESPAFLFYAANFLAKTSGWSAAEVGAYIRLLADDLKNSERVF